MTAYLTGTRPGHALFTSVGRAVVVDLVALTASTPFPDYEVIPDQWDETPNPAHVPTAAFTAADDAFADVVVLNASGKRSGKRTYAVPKNVRDAAQHALTAGGGTAVERAVATALCAGKPVSYDTVRHVNMYFEYADLTGLTAAAESGFWGGSAGEHWASKIVVKEVALRAAAAAPHDLGLSEKGALNPAPSQETIEDDPGAEVPWGDVDPSERHVFQPLSITNPWDCAYCFGPEGALIHTQDMREQVIANYGEGSDELAQYDAYLATFDEPSIESVRTLPMSAGGVLWNVEVPRTGPNVMLASAFFRDEHGDGCDYHAETDGDGAVSKVYIRRPDDSWGQWNPQAVEWEDAGDASENDLMPLDDNGAYIVAMRQSENGGAPVAPHDIHPMEWAAADEAYDDIADEVDSFEETEPEFFVQTDESDDTQVHALYAKRDGKWFVWDENDADWRATPEPTNVAQVDDDEAEQVGRFLSWAQDGVDPGDDTITAATRIPKTGTRARRADQPGQVQRPSSRVPGSERSPYTSRTTAPGQSWFRKAGKKSPYYAPGEYGPSASQPGTEGYTPQERSANAKKQVRDGAGRFAQGGSTVSTKAGTGTITKIDPTTQQVQVQYGDGTSAWVNAKETRVQSGNAGTTATPNPNSPYRTSNDGGEVWLPADGPRATATTPKAYLSQLQPMLTSEQLQAMLDNTSGYFAQERARAARINQNWNSTGRAVTASANHDGVMVAFFLDPEMAQQFAVDGGEPPESLHMTLAYLGDQDEAGVSADELARVVGEWAAQTPPISGEISGHGVFTNGDKPVTHMSVDCPDLPAARQSLIEHLQANGLHPRMDHGFDPHITLAYDNKPVEVPATPVTFNKVTVSHGENDMDMPMGDAVPMMAAATKGDTPMTPETSDVEPLHLAIVDPVDKSAVMELIDLVPASANSTAPVLFKRTATGWEQDDNLLSSLQGATPPPVVTLDKNVFADVLKQVDTTLAQKKPEDPAAVAASGEIALYNEYGELLPALVAAGGQEITPKDIAATERLKRYWTVGPGGAKIRWGQGGDFNRCVRHLTKYLGPRAKGYCFSGDTEFTTRDGVMTFEDAVGTTQLVLTQAAPTSDRAQGHRKDGYWVEAEIQPFGEQRLLSVTLTRSGQIKVIRATPEHRWFASEDSKSRKRLSVAEMTTADLRPGMALAALSPKSLTDRSTPSPFGIAAGVVYGDGTLDGTRGAMIDLWGEKDAYLLRYFEGCAMGVCKKESTGLLGTRVRSLPASWKSLPSLSEGHSYLYGWLAGYIAADGSVSTDGAITLYSADRASLEHARTVATRLGIETLSILVYDRAGIDGAVTPLYRLRFLGSSVPADLLVLPEHRARFEAAEKSQSPVRWRVVSVEDHGEVERVYCAVVPETETFVLTDGIWVHNCQLRHHDVLGFYTGTHAKMLHGKRRGVRGGAMFDIPDEQVRIELLASWERAERTPVTADGAPPMTGARFRIPVVVPEGVPTGDGRIFKPLAVTTRDLPLPLMWQLKTGEGHDGSVIIGRIDSIERISNGLGNAYGVFDTNPHAVEAERLVREGFLRGVSADLDNFEAETAKADDELGKESDDKSEKIAPEQTTISRARVMGVTAVPKPAFQECTIELLEDEPEQEVPVITDGVYSERDDEALVACALVASQIPIVPPADWFGDPGLREPTPLTVTDDGRVFGHIAAWHVDHIGMAFGTKPPRSRSGYKYFHTGVVRTDDGKDVPVGQLTLAGGHAKLELTADAAVKHYDDTKSAVADVHAGEDAYGIWVAGALRPDVDAAKIRSFRASAPSGDWRPINGRLELVAVCQVNVPGFPIARARVASGYVTALVAAGAAPLAQLKGLSVEDRVKKLEAEALQAKMDAVQARMAPTLSAHAQEMAVRASAARERMQALLADATDFADYSPETRMDYARKGWAMPGDGAYPIANVADLKNAIRAYGRAASGDKAKVRRHIMRRARGLGRADLIPSAWTSASVEERHQDVKAAFSELAQGIQTLNAAAGVQAPLEDLITKRDELVARVAAVTSPGKPDTEHPAVEVDGVEAQAPVVDKAPAKPKFDPKEHPRFDTNGQFRQVMARLRSGIQGQAGTETIARQIDHVMELMDEGDLSKIDSEGKNLMKAIKDAAETTDHKDISENLRAGFKALGMELAKLPLPQGQDTVTMRWTDLPVQLQNTVEDVMTKLKTHLTPEAYAKVTSEMSDYKSGVDLATSDQIQSWLSSMLQYLLDS